MNRFTFLILSLLISFTSLASPRVIHVFTALCDNENQGIVPVPNHLGKGDDPAGNLYWGAYYGIKGYLKRNKDWTLLQTTKVNATILERCIFKHKTTDTYLVAEAYDGRYIQRCIEDYMSAIFGNLERQIVIDQQTLSLGKKADLLAYTGHDGLMEFSIDASNWTTDQIERPSITLACYSKEFFKPYFQKTKTNPLVWTNGLMAPEAYTLKAAIDGWLLNESNQEIKERAAQAYHAFQKCGIKGARNLFSTGF